MKQQKWEESEKRKEEERRAEKKKSQKKEDPGARKDRKVANRETQFFSMFCGAGGSKIGLGCGDICSDERSKIACPSGKLKM